MSDAAPSACPPTARDLVCGLLHAAATAEERLERGLEPFGLSLAKLGALQQLATAGEPLSLGQLAERLSCVKSNVTQLMDRLEADGLVRRAPHPGDRRTVRAVITDEGRRRFTAAAEAKAHLEAELFADLGEEDRARLAALLGSLAADAR